MMQYDRIILGRKARELGFVRDTFEKVCRLINVLDFIQKDELLSKTLALKGRTAINLTHAFDNLMMQKKEHEEHLKIV